jgi:hypothetical protein
VPPRICTAGTQFALFWSSLGASNKELEMEPITIVVIVVAVVLIAAALWYAFQMQNRKQLKAKFGPEYDRAVAEAGDRRSGEKELLEREKRVEALRIRTLNPQERDRFVKSWRNVQTRFVDAPVDAVQDADHLVVEVLEARGYPVGDFDQRAADISVNHPRVVRNYRAARGLAERSRTGNATTEDLRKAMVHYRELFEDLLEVEGTTQEVKVDKAS